MAILTREAILGAQDLKRQKIKVPEWDGEIILMELSAARRIEMENLLPKDEDNGKIWPLLVAFCCVDEEGKPVFTLEDVAALEEKNAKVLAKIGRVALRMNRLGIREEAEMAENFTGSQG